MAKKTNYDKEAFITFETSIKEFVELASTYFQGKGTKECEALLDQITEDITKQHEANLISKAATKAKNLIFSTEVQKKIKSIKEKLAFKGKDHDHLEQAFDEMIANYKQVCNEIVNQNYSQANRIIQESIKQAKTACKNAEATIIRSAEARLPMAKDDRHDMLNQFSSIQLEEAKVDIAYTSNFNQVKNTQQDGFSIEKGKKAQTDDEIQKIFGDINNDLRKLNLSGGSTLSSCALTRENDVVKIDTANVGDSPMKLILKNGEEIEIVELYKDGIPQGDDKIKSLQAERGIEKRSDGRYTNTYSNAGSTELANSVGDTLQDNYFGPNIHHAEIKLVDGKIQYNGKEYEQACVIVGSDGMEKLKTASDDHNLNNVLRNLAKEEQGLQDLPARLLAHRADNKTMKVDNFTMLAMPITSEIKLTEPIVMTVADGNGKYGQKKAMTALRTLHNKISKETVLRTDKDDPNKEIKIIGMTKNLTLHENNQKLLKKVGRDQDRYIKTKEDFASFKQDMQNKIDLIANKTWHSEEKVETAYDPSNINNICLKHIKNQLNDLPKAQKKQVEKILNSKDSNKDQIDEISKIPNLSLSSVDASKTFDSLLYINLDNRATTDDFEMFATKFESFVHEVTQFATFDNDESIKQIQTDLTNCKNFKLSYIDFGGKPYHAKSQKYSKALEMAERIDHACYELSSQLLGKELQERAGIEGFANRLDRVYNVIGNKNDEVIKANTLELTNIIHQIKNEELRKKAEILLTNIFKNSELGVERLNEIYKNVITEKYNETIEIIDSEIKSIEGKEELSKKNEARLEELKNNKTTLENQIKEIQEAKDGLMTQYFNYVESVATEEKEVIDRKIAKSQSNYDKSQEKLADAKLEGDNVKQITARNFINTAATAQLDNVSKIQGKNLEVFNSSLKQAKSYFKNKKTYSEVELLGNSMKQYQYYVEGLQAMANLMESNVEASEAMGVYSIPKKHLKAVLADAREDYAALLEKSSAALNTLNNDGSEDNLSALKKQSQSVRDAYYLAEKMQEKNLNNSYKEFAQQIYYAIDSVERVKNSWQDKESEEYKKDNQAKQAAKQLKQELKKTFGSLKSYSKPEEYFTHNQDSKATLIAFLNNPDQTKHLKDMCKFVREHKKEKNSLNRYKITQALITTTMSLYNALEGAGKVLATALVESLGAAIVSPMTYLVTDIMKKPINKARDAHEKPISNAALELWKVIKATPGRAAEDLSTRSEHVQNVASKAWKKLTSTHEVSVKSHKERQEKRAAERHSENKR